jgi:hypothetical protein
VRYLYVTIIVLALANPLLGQSAQVGQVLENFALDHIDKGQVGKSQLLENSGRGQILEFTSVTCLDCQTNLPKMEALLREAWAPPTKLVFIDRSQKSILNYVQKKQIQTKVANDPEKVSYASYGVPSIPYLIAINKDNQVVYVHGGVILDSDIENLREALSK